MFVPPCFCLVAFVVVRLMFCFACLFSFFVRQKVCSHGCLVRLCVLASFWFAVLFVFFLGFSLCLINCLLVLKAFVCLLVCLSYFRVFVSCLFLCYLCLFICCVFKFVLILLLFLMFFTKGKRPHTHTRILHPDLSPSSQFLTFDN